MKHLSFIFYISLAMCACHHPASLHPNSQPLQDNEKAYITLSNDTVTPYTFAIGDVVYPIHITPQGHCYIVRTAKNGTQYKQQLAEEVSLQVCNELNIEYR